MIVLIQMVSPEGQPYTLVICGDSFLLLLPEQVKELRDGLKDWNEYAELSPGTPYTTPVVINGETFEKWQPEHDNG